MTIKTMSKIKIKKKKKEEKTIIMQYLFLDVDGVLNNQTPDFDHSCLRELKRIIDATKVLFISIYFQI